MAKNKTRQPENKEILGENNNPVALVNTPDQASAENSASLQKTISALVFQAWLGIAVWMSFGLLLEGFLGFRTPAYLLDTTRRELFRLAHAHGTLLSLMLLGAAFCFSKGFVSANKYGVFALQSGAILMPVGFLLGGIYTFGSDPNFLVIFAPLGGLFLIFGAISMAISARQHSKQ